MSYLKEKFLLSNKSAKKLYDNFAKNIPIFDYHCHLSEKQILENAEFKDVFEIWLAGDHYKWRLMRNFGINEEYITGNKSNEEKFIAYCTALGTAFGNPLYHWSQIEIQEFFGCNLEINEENAEKIWNECNAYIQSNRLTPQKLIENSNVKRIFTTNEIFDDLEVFEKIQKMGYKFTVTPAFRADKIMNIDAELFLEHLNKLQSITREIKNLSDLESVLEKRLNDFILHGCKASDIALESVQPLSSREEASKVFEFVLAGNKPSVEQANAFKSYLTYSLLRLFAKYDIATELHIGAMRNNNSVMFAKLGLDTGYDSISEKNSIYNLSALLDKLNSENSLPKLIIFNLNPKMNTEIMTLIGCFQDDSAKGKLQFGPAWWFLDNKVGMENHLKDLTATGHIGTFIGMLTDSRSFLSYPRHHYFRKILCSYLGELMEKGEITQNLEFVGKVVSDICYANAIKYFGVEG